MSSSGPAHAIPAGRAPAATPRAGLPDRIPAVWLVLIGIASVQFGAAIAKSLFVEVPPTAMVWLRLASSAVILTLIARPSLRGRGRPEWLVALAFGLVLAAMNVSFYQSFARIPLGMAVTIEFLGPLALALLGSRRPIDLVWVALAGAGVALLGFSPVGLNVPGVVLALVAGVLWACYIVLSAQTGQRWPGLSGLAVASTVGAVVLAPAALGGSGTALLDPRILALGAAVGLMSSVIPYSLELIALRRITPRLLGILMSLEPAAGALVAMVLLGELLAPLQWLAIACVVVASIGAARGSSAAAEPIPA
jgi:inner membrane transporter RhtA